MEPKIREAVATIRDIEHVAQNLRVEDLAEIQAAGYLSAAEAIAGSVDASDETRAVFLKGELALVYGVASCGARPDNLRVGIPWVLTTYVAQKYPKLFVMASRMYLPSLLKNYDLLVNFVDARYDAAIRWLRMLGFWVGEPEPFGVNNEMFRPFVLKKDDAHV